MNLLNNWSNISSASLFSLRLHIFSSDALTLFSKLIPLESFLCGSTLRRKKRGGNGVRGRNRRKKKKLCVCEMWSCTDTAGCVYVCVCERDAGMPYLGQAS